MAKHLPAFPTEHQVAEGLVAFFGGAILHLPPLALVQSFY